MAHPRKKSRLITVGSTVYRWRIGFHSYDAQHQKGVAIYGDKLTNGAEIRFDTNAQAITPKIIRRALEHGLRNGFDPADSSTSRHLSEEEVTEVVYGFAHSLTFGSAKYTWTPNFRGGLHMELHSAEIPAGQVMSTMVSLSLHHLTNELAAAFIAFGLHSGWKPTQTGLDCYWIESEACQQIVAEQFPGWNGKSPFHTSGPSDSELQPDGATF